MRLLFLDIYILGTTSNNRALFTLLILVLTSITIFHIERQFLVAGARGMQLNQYKQVPWIDKILLLVDDFEGFPMDNTPLPKEEYFCFGSARISLDHSHADGNLLSQKSSLKVEWTGTDNYGGWGKGVGVNLDLDTSTDFFNFRLYNSNNKPNDETLKITIEEDDNDDGVLQKDKDDEWCYIVGIPAKNNWQIISVPLKDFRDINEGGDHRFNITRKGGIHTLIFTFQNPEKYKIHEQWFFDFICFSRGNIFKDQPLSITTLKYDYLRRTSKNIF